MDISQALLCEMEKMVKSKVLAVPAIKAWSWLIRLFGSKAGENRALVNQMLKVAEVTFTSSEPQIQIASLVAWRALIDALIQQDADPQQQAETDSPVVTPKPHLIPSVKRLKLLMTPLLTIMSGATLPAVRRACWLTWTYFCHKLDLSINDCPVQAVVVIPMFELIFKGGPERGPSGVWDLCLNTLEAWITCKLHDKLDVRSTQALSVGLQDGVTSPRTPSQTKTTEPEAESFPIKWVSCSLQSLESILTLIKALWMRGMKDLKQVNDRLSLNGALRMLYLVVKGVDGEGKGAIMPSAENVASVHAVLQFVNDLSADIKSLEEIEEPVSTLWPVLEVLMEFGYLVLSSSFYKIPFCLPGNKHSSGFCSFHLSSPNAETLHISENLVTPIVYITAMWINVGCLVLRTRKEVTTVLQKLEKLSQHMQTGLGLMINLQGVGFILDRLLCHMSHKQESLKAETDSRVSEMKANTSAKSRGPILSAKDYYLLQVWNIFAHQLSRYVENSNDIPAIESGTQDSGYQMVHRYLVFPVQVFLYVFGCPPDSHNILQGNISHIHDECSNLVQRPSDLDFAFSAWTKLYDCCCRVSSLKSSQANVFGSVYCQKLSRLLEAHERCLDQGDKGRHALGENPLLQDMLGVVVKHVLRQTDITSLAMLAINRKKRLGSFVGGSYVNNSLFGNEIEDTSRIRETLCLASRLLELSWSRLTLNKVCWLGLTARVLSALSSFVARLYLQQDCFILLQELSRALAKWLSFSGSSLMKDNRCPTFTILQKALQDLWEKLLTLLQRCQPPLSYNSDLLSFQTPLLVPAFQNPETSISNLTLAFWESTYGCKASFLKYPPCLVPALKQLKGKVKITLPGWEKNMSPKNTSEIVSDKPVGRKHRHLLQGETISRKRIKETNVSHKHEIDEKQVSPDVCSSTPCGNVKTMSTLRSVDMLLRKIKRPTCALDALMETSPRNTVPGCSIAAEGANPGLSERPTNVDLLLPSGVKSVNQSCEVKQVGAAYGNSQATVDKELHQELQSISPVWTKSASAISSPCDDMFMRNKGNVVQPLLNNCGSNNSFYKTAMECEDVPASEWDALVSGRRKKLKFLDDEQVEYTTIPVTQKKAGPLTEHQKEVRLAQSGKFGSECSSHGAGIRTYTSIDFSQSQIVFDSEDAENILLDIPVQVSKDDDDKVKLAAEVSDSVSLHSQSKQTRQIGSDSEKKLENVKVTASSQECLPDDCSDLPGEVPQNSKPCAVLDTHHNLIRKKVLENVKLSCQHSSEENFKLMTPAKTLRSGRKRIQQTHTTGRNALKCFSQKGTNVASVSGSDQNEDPMLSRRLKSNVADQALAKVQIKLETESLYSSRDKQELFVLSQQNEIPDSISGDNVKGLQHSNSEIREEKEKQPHLRDIESLIVSESTPKKVADEGDKPSDCVSDLCHLLERFDQQGCNGETQLINQTQLITQPCDTHLYDTQAPLASENEGFVPQPYNGMVYDMLSAASSSNDWQGMDMQCLESVQVLINSIQRQIHQRKMILMARECSVE
ncbi:hypothetical protein KP509_33G044800 [Ceratopteris richardii]|nr:hypothetical protein KP509_33G044800 [Ceratopteris richardii]